MKTTCLLTLLACTLLFACQKNKDKAGPSNAKLSYGDSVFYLKAADYTISPLSTRTGTYTAFPSNLNLDPGTGKITVGLAGKDGVNSQTGLRYRVVFTPSEGQSDTTYLVLAGINYQDRVYYLGQNQTTADPIYNGSSILSMPGGSFSASNNKLAINPATGRIDLQQTIDNSFFHNDPRDNDWEIVTINYRTNDQASRTNSLDVVLYYYSATQKIPANVSAVMRAHQELLLGMTPMDIPVTTAPADTKVEEFVSFAKPRPPCIIVIGR